MISKLPIKITVPVIIIIIILLIAGYFIFIKKVFSPAEIELSISKEEAECLKSGGDWRQIRMQGGKVCNPGTSDAGKKCTDNGQCEGRCIAVTDASGECSKFKIIAGCNSYMQNGKASGTLCVD